MSEPKPSLFIGSSREGLEFARAARTHLADAAEVTLWNEGVYEPNATFIESLIKALGQYDFAALILTRDDQLVSRNDEVFGPRDNVIFELGLFMGRLGRERTFVVRSQADALKLPSDLAGVAMASYEWPRTDNNHLAAMGRACDGIRRAICSLGPNETKMYVHVRRVEKEQLRQRQDIDALKFLVQNFVTKWEHIHLAKLASGQPFPFQHSDSFESELRRLLAMGLITRKPGRFLSTMFKAGDDVHNHLEITDRGRNYVELRTRDGDGE